MGEKKQLDEILDAVRIEVHINLRNGTRKMRYSAADTFPAGTPFIEETPELRDCFLAFSSGSANIVGPTWRYERIADTTELFGQSSTRILKYSLR
jgi:hypothetical protein